MIMVLGTPLNWAMVFSPISHLAIVALLVPLYGAAVAFILLENCQVLLHLVLSEQENRRLANADPLTGLPNRIMKRRRFDHDGHAAGDAILAAVAHRLRDWIRDIALIFRVGGDEFVILLPALDTDQQNTFRIDVSVGGAYFPRDGHTADELLRSADSAMYEAKRRGKGVFVAYRPAETAPSSPPHRTPTRKGLTKRGRPGHRASVATGSIDPRRASRCRPGSAATAGYPLPIRPNLL